MTSEFSTKKEVSAEEKTQFGERPFGEKEQVDTGELAQYVLKKIISAQPKIIQSKVMDLTQSQEILLRRLYSVKESGAELKMTDLSVMLGSTKSAASQAVSKLERMGLVKRKWSKEDRRRVLVGLTPKGAAAVEAFNKSLLEFIQTKLDKMEEGEIRVFVSMFEKCMN